MPFRPQLQTDSNRWVQRDPAVRTEDALIYQGRIRQENIEKRKKQLNDKLLEDCNNFRPKINKKSKFINENQLDFFKSQRRSPDLLQKQFKTEKRQRSPNEDENVDDDDEFEDLAELQDSSQIVQDQKDPSQLDMSARQGKRVNAVNS